MCSCANKCGCHPDESMEASVLCRLLLINALM